MQIYLVQHGESKPDEIDPERRLTESGAQAVRKVADFLRRSGGSGPRISVIPRWRGLPWR